MKRSLVLLLFCFTLFQGFSYAQNIYGGIRLEPNFLVTDLSVHQAPFNLEPAISLGIKLSDKFSLEGRWGLLFAGDFSGEQYGLYARGNILQDNFYALGGINFHSYFGYQGQDGTGRDELHTLLGAGIGFNATEKFSVELHYYKTLNEKFFRSYYLDENMERQTDYQKLYHIIKLSLGYNFNLTSTPGKEKSTIEKEESAVETLKEKRHLFLAGGTGYPDLLHTQLGYQILDYLSVAGVLNWNVYSNPKLKEFSAGLKLTGYFSGPGFNNVSVEYSRELDNFFSSSKEGITVMTVGGDNIIPDRYFHFFWAAGLMTSNSNGSFRGGFPVFKVGTNLNF